MPTQEDRIAALEQKVADIELERLYERKKATESTPSEQAYDVKQVNYRLTMLLGIASGQEHDIRAIKNDLGSVKEDVNTLKEDVSAIKERLGSMETKFNEHTTLLTQILA